jgi:hypothetical protein
VSRTFGIEIEMVGLGCPQIADVLNAVIGGKLEEVTNPNDPNERMWEITVAEESIWTVLDDDTLDPPSGELVTPKLVESDLPLVSKIVEALRDAGARRRSMNSGHSGTAMPTGARGAIVTTTLDIAG